MRKEYFMIGLFIILMASCLEEFEYKNPDNFNQSIEGRNDINTAEELILLYLDYPPNEGIPNLRIETEKLKSDSVQITLIRDRQQDDAQRATKIILTAKKDEKSWKVLEIKVNKKCYNGRGHKRWGIAPCG